MMVISEQIKFQAKRRFEPRRMYCTFFTTSNDFLKLYSYSLSDAMEIPAVRLIQRIANIFALVSRCKRVNDSETNQNPGQKRFEARRM